MALFDNAKDYIEEVFYTNGAEEIKGATAQTGMKSFIDLIGEGEFKGLATPLVNPAAQTDKGNAFYIASSAGYYTHFSTESNAIIVASGQLCAIKYNHTYDRWDKIILATISGGTGGTTVITCTVAELQADIINSALTQGALYIVTDADSNLYGGTEIYLQAITANAVNQWGVGKFYNNYGKADLHSESGTYEADDVVRWGFYLWKNLTGAAGTQTDDFTLDGTNWEVVPFSDTEYDAVYDKIKYAVSMDYIVYREDVYSNIVSCEAAHDSYDNSIKYYRWGESGSTGNRIIDSLVMAVNSSISNICKNNLYQSKIDCTNIDSGSTIQQCELVNSEIYGIEGVNLYMNKISMLNSKLYNSMFSNTGSVYFENCTLTNSIINIEVTNGGYIRNAHWIDSTIIRWIFDNTHVLNTTFDKIYIDDDYANYPTHENTIVTGITDLRFTNSLQTATTPTTVFVRENNEMKEIAVEDLITKPVPTSSGWVSTTSAITPDLSYDRYLTENSNGILSGILIDAFDNIPLTNGESIFIIKNTAASALKLTFRTSSLSQNGVTYTFRYMQGNTASIPASKDLECSIWWEYSDSTHCEIRFSFIIMA